MPISVMNRVQMLLLSQEKIWLIGADFLFSELTPTMWLRVVCHLEIDSDGLIGVVQRSDELTVTT
jgi:hypothetical protein